MMKLTKNLIDKLIHLRDGGTLPASQLSGKWVDELLRDGILISTSHGSRRTLHAPQAAALIEALTAIDERYADLDVIRALKSDEMPRSVQAFESGNSKLIPIRSCPGFPINSYEPIICILNGRDFIVHPQEGSFTFVTDWRTFSIPVDVTVVGVENMENFRMIRQQRQLFEQTIGPGRLLFVARYPQSTDLVSWLKMHPNNYVHFGDFDLAGINIFLTEFLIHLGERSSFFIPDDIETRLLSGSKERYNSQYMRFKNLKTDIHSLQSLIALMNKFHRCYDQEGYIDN